MFAEPRPTRIDIDLDALMHNYSELKRHVAPARLMPVLKANAYGHGAVRCAKCLEDLGADYFAVAFLEEAIVLRDAGIRTPILAVGGISGRQAEGFIRYNVDITASSVDKLRRIDEVASKLGQRARIHLKIDTGMERIGTHYYNAESLFQAASEATSCDIVGIFSHLACAEQEDTRFSKLQFERFQELLTSFERKFEKPVLRHIANSGGLLRFPQSHYDIVRPGLALYGFAPAPDLKDILDLRPVLTLRSEVVYFKVVEPGVGVSYDHSWKTSKQTRIVTVPIGYGDGYPRRLSNKAAVLIRGKKYPIVGTICMDQFMVDIGWDEAFLGDEVVLIGDQGDESISVCDLARTLETDPREVLCGLNARVPRTFLSSNE